MTETAETEVEPTPTETVAPPSIPAELENVVNAGCPIIKGLARKTHLICACDGASYFRVNFHDRENANIVIKSAFVIVKEGKADVSWEVSGK